MWSSSSPPSWTFRELDIDITITHKQDLYAAVRAALRLQLSVETVVIEVVRNNGERSHISVPPLPKDNCNASWSPVLCHGSSIESHIAIIEDTKTSLTDAAKCLGRSQVMRLQQQPDRATLQFCYSSSHSMGIASGWFLVYVARALQYIRTRGLYPCPDDLSLPPFDTLLRPVGALGEDGPMALSSDMTLHQHFARSAHIDPLSQAVVYYDIQDGFAVKQKSFTYGELLACAFVLACNLAALSNDDEACIPITSADPAVITVITVISLAASISGRSFVLAPSSSCNEIVHPDSRLGTLLQESATTLLKDSSRLLYDGSMWEDMEIPTFAAANSAASAFWLSSSLASGAGGKEWRPTSHEKSAAVVARRRTKFEVSGPAKVLFYRCNLDNWTTMFIWEAFLSTQHRGAVQVIANDKQPVDMHIASLVRQTGSTHIAMGDQDTILSLCDTFGLVQQRKGLKAILVKAKATMEPLAQFAGPAMISYDQGWDETIQLPEPPLTPPENPTIIYQEPAFPLDPDSILDRVSKGQTLKNIGAKVINIGDALLVKYGSGVRMTEVHNALYARSHTSIPIPNIHLAFRQSGALYVVMDYIHGESLLHRWNDLTEEQLASVLSQLKDYLAQLQNLRGSVPGPVDGPFPTYDDFVAWLTRMLRHSKAENLVEPFSTANPLVFTHQDISPRNLIVDESGKLWIIDWDRAGWYPIYFEYACIQQDIGVPQAPTPAGWRKAALSVLPDYAEEYRSLQAIAWALDVMPFA
ncbi:hypothetical protein BC629DRAFT_1591282 [Irpex lacteus]|nr:hypothetical protein BC629DRAFT_1591282 [Irpex lacteus]